jgi:flagellar protein FlaF
MQHASKAYANIAKETASPRELEATLLLRAAAKLQAVHDKWEDKSNDLDEAVLYNRRLWTVFIDAVLRDDSLLPVAVRQNLANLGVFVMNQTFSLMTNPLRSNLLSLIKINREIAAGLRGNG